jgi:hypothetical protein
MNAKQTAPLLATLPALASIPPVLIIAAIGLGFLWLLSDDEKEKPTADANLQKSTAEAQKPASGQTAAEIREIPASGPIRSASDVTVPPPAIKSFLKIIETIQTPQKANTKPVQMPSAKEKSITREHLAFIFLNGTRMLSRKAAVAALKNLGFGRTAAYEALSQTGGFTSWLYYASDGMITWTLNADAR